MDDTDNNPQSAIRNPQSLAARWESLFSGEGKARLEAALPDYLRGRRWFSAKARTISRVRVVEAVPFSEADGTEPIAYITFIQVEYAEGDAQTFVLPLAISEEGDGEKAQSPSPELLVARLDVGGVSQVVYDASGSAPFARALLDSIGKGRQFRGASSQVRTWPTPIFGEIAGSDPSQLAPRIVGTEQSNTSIIYGDRFILKLFRRLEGGVSPDLEIGRFLTEKGFAHIPPLAGAVERVQGDSEPQTLAILQGFVPNQGDAWSYTLRSLEGYFDQATGQPGAAALEESEGEHQLDLLGKEPSVQIRAALGDYLASARLLGRRTAQLHLALASGVGEAAFAPEPFTAEYQRSLFESVQKLADHALRLLRDRLHALPGATRTQAERVISLRANIRTHLEPLLEREIAALRTRCHGDYHLGQVLYTGDDFVIIDFEGEPIRSLEERRRKHSPLKDVAGMLRSFHYAAYAAMFGRVSEERSESDKERLGQWASAWHRWVGAGFLTDYLQEAQEGTILPSSEDSLRVLLDAYLLEKAIYELLYELNNRPDWVRIPLEGIEQLAQ